MVYFKNELIKNSFNRNPIRNYLIKILLKQSKKLIDQILCSSKNCLTEELFNRKIKLPNGTEKNTWKEHIFVDFTI